MSFLPDPCTPMSMSAGFPHTPVCARWIHTCTPSQGTHACTLACTGSPRPLARKAQHTHTGSPCPLGLCACTHRVPMPARSWDPYASMHEAIHTHLHRAMYARSHQAPTPAWSPCMHAPGPCAHACTGPPHPLGLHAHTHRAYALMCSVPAIRVRETKS